MASDDWDFESGREDLNLRPPAPKAGALTRLRYAPTEKTHSLITTRPERQRGTPPGGQEKRSVSSLPGVEPLHLAPDEVRISRIQQVPRTFHLLPDGTDADDRLDQHGGILVFEG